MTGHSVIAAMRATIGLSSFNRSGRAVRLRRVSWGMNAGALASRLSGSEAAIGKGGRTQPHLSVSDGKCCLSRRHDGLVNDERLQRG